MIAEVNTTRIVATAFCEGRTHDVQLFKESRCGILPQIRVLTDAGYQGVAERHAVSQTPVKNTTLHPLTKEHKASHRALSRQRIVIENILRTLKIFRILSERYRHRRKRVTLRVNVIAAIDNVELNTAK